ncbi:WSC domain-containing protein [Amylocarpus encephaloides]|uniref:WSC domain-containing protein n=1 Tax=Amylocarpus encephaloides TaxID=45428 RepID=A0A9P7YRL5_9HELO|nr:WSC domain-containing protein [Amylocarpus encephaloides]
MAPISAFCARLSILFAFVSTAVAQTAASSASTPATSTSASINPGTSAWTYQGCYNETVGTNGTAGARALAGTTDALDTMTVPICLNFCASSSYEFAGLEYTRECYCSHYLSSISAKLPDATCNLACVGNSSEICGGSLALSVYQAKKSTKSESVKGAQKSPMASVLALGIAMAFLMCMA